MALELKRCLVEGFKQVKLIASSSAFASTKTTTSLSRILLFTSTITNTPSFSSTKPTTQTCISGTP
ncbi:Platelet glycoprotein Ib alpha chain [Sesbania bispinosa]|nr:Platelet glycoprotein Ib alpha chain [Sesbania bispinosa]